MYDARFSGNFGFYLDGVGQPAYCKKVDPGSLENPTTKHHQGVNIEAPTSLSGKPKWSPIKVDISLGMGRGILEWINEAFRKNPTPKNGNIVECDANFKAVRHWEFYDAFITEVTFPAFDAASTDAIYLSMTLQPYEVRVKESPGGEIVQVNEGYNRAQDFTCANFRCWTATMGQELGRSITKVDSFTFKHNVKEAPKSANKLQTWIPGNFEMPELSISYHSGPNNDMNKFMDEWAYNALYQRRKQTDQTCDIEFLDLAANEGDELGGLTFSRVGIHKGPHQTLDASAGAVSTNTVKLFTGSMQMQLRTDRMDT